MNRYIKISAALAAFALLLVVMGLSTQGDGGRAVGLTDDHLLQRLRRVHHRKATVTTGNDLTLLHASHM